MGRKRKASVRAKRSEKTEAVPMMKVRWYGRDYAHCMSCHSALGGFYSERVASYRYCPHCGDPIRYDADIKEVALHEV